MPPFNLTEPLRDQFGSDGYLLVSRLFDRDEIAGLNASVRSDQGLNVETYGKRDAAGNETKLAVRNQLVESPYSAIVRSQRVATTMEGLLGDEIYHYHHKLMI